MSSVVFSQKIVPQAIAALEAARKAGVSVTVDCQCDGIVIDGHHWLQPAGFYDGTR